jgi:(p)ppGpp synthase/HD superfamily hydrolase
MTQHGYSDSIHHALAFCAKHYPAPVSRSDGHNPLLATASIAIILSRHQADDTTIVAGVLKQLADASPSADLATLQHRIACRFGGQVAAAVTAASEPRFDPLGRERTWKTSRFEALARLAGASPRVIEIWIATEIHCCGRALSDIRRLGAEYARSVAPAPPDELLWWYRALLEVLESRGADCRPALLAELRALSREVGQFLAGQSG